MKVNAENVPHYEDVMKGLLEKADGQINKILFDSINEYAETVECRIKEAMNTLEGRTTT